MGAGALGDRVGDLLGGADGGPKPGELPAVKRQIKVKEGAAVDVHAVQHVRLFTGQVALRR